MDASKLSFSQAVRMALLYTTAPISMWRAAGVNMVGDLIAGVVGKVIDRAWPDPTEKAKAAIAIEEMRQAGEFKAIDAALQQAQMQADVNTEQAKSADPFTSRARPFIMWTCGVSLGYAAIIDPFARFIAAVAYQYAGPFPAVDTTITLQILLGLLGLGGMRTYEKSKGVAS
jgi:hypothetical protein